MNLTIDETIGFLEYLVDVKTKNLIEVKKYLSEYVLLDEDALKKIDKHIQETTTEIKKVKNDENKSKNIKAALDSGKKDIMDLLDAQFESWFKDLSLPIPENSKEKIKTLLTTINESYVKQHLTESSENDVTINIEDQSPYRYADVNTKFRDSIISDILLKFTFDPKQLSKEKIDQFSTEQQLTNLALQEAKDNRSYLRMFGDKISEFAVGTKEAITNNPKKSVAFTTALAGLTGGVGAGVTYGMGWFITAMIATASSTGGALLGSGITAMLEKHGLENCQGLLNLYTHYKKIKPIFQTDDDEEILKILKNKGFTKKQQQTNQFKIAQASVILSDLPPNELIKALNVKLMTLEQQIWQLIVQPCVHWDSEHREALQQLMGLLLVIEQTNRELAVATLEASDNYQTNDAWWKIFSVAGSLLPGLMVKFTALNYLSHWFGSSSAIEASVGEGMINIIGYLRGDSSTSLSDIKDNSQLISISTNSSNSRENFTSAMLTTGLAIDTLSMVVATRIAYLNYSSATDAYKKMIGDAESTATHVIDRCSRLIGERLNHIDRAIPFLKELEWDKPKRNFLLEPDDTLEIEDKKDPKDEEYKQQKAAASKLYKDTIRPAFLAYFPKKENRDIEKDLPQDLMFDDKDTFDGYAGFGTVTICKGITREQNTTIMTYAICHETSHAITKAVFSKITDKKDLPQPQGDCAKKLEYIADLIATEVMKEKMGLLEDLKKYIYDIEKKLGGGDATHPSGKLRIEKMLALLKKEKDLKTLVNEVLA